MKFTSKIVLLGSFAIFAAACGNKSPQQVLSDIKGDSHQAQDEIALSGTYDDQCNPNVPVPLAATLKLAGINVSATKIEYHFDGTSQSFNRKTHLYSATDCNEGSSIGTAIQSGTVSAQGTTKVSEGVKMAFSYTTAEIVLTNADAIKAANTVGFCGHKDYAPNALINVTANDTDTIANDLKCPVVDVVPRVTYDIVQKPNDNLLQFGTSGEEKDASKVPATVDQKYSFQKQ